MPLPFVDAHCHLTDPRAEPHVDEWLKRAREKNIGYWMIGGVDPADWERQRALRKRVPEVLTSYGVHPWVVAQSSDATLDAQLGSLRALAAEPHAIGETGLDHGSRGGDEPDRQRQRRAFEAHIEIARVHQKPLVLHIVHAHDEAIAILKRSSPVSGLVHSFSGNVQALKEYVKLALLISVSGGVTRPGYETLKRAVQRIPPESLVIETDAPDQAPAGGAPGELNEPARLIEIAHAVATLRNEDPELVLRRSTENFRRLFPTK